jgi:hypothetical protein
MEIERKIDKESNMSLELIVESPLDRREVNG